MEQSTKGNVTIHVSKGILGTVLVVVLCLVTLVSLGFDPTVEEWTVIRSVNYTHWHVEPDTSVGVDTTAFFLSNAGSGQILIVNPDVDDTLGISFDNGTNWFKLQPNLSSVGFNPANEDSIHFMVFGITTGDSVIYPVVSWTTLSEDR